MSDTQATLVPTSDDFCFIVKYELTQWGVSTVEGLCTQQTQTVINNLSAYFHGEEKNLLKPDVDEFKKVVREFQEKKERYTFDDVTDKEATELIAALSPHFHNKLEDTPAADSDDLGDLENHPF